jgi:hypothetical protein
VLQAEPSIENQNGVKCRVGSQLRSESIQVDMDETVEFEKKRALWLAHSLVEEAWNLGAAPMTLTVEYEGAAWEVTVRVVASEG